MGFHVKIFTVLLFVIIICYFIQFKYQS